LFVFCFSRWRCADASWSLCPSFFHVWVLHPSRPTTPLVARLPCRGFALPLWVAPLSVIVRLPSPPVSPLIGLSRCVFGFVRFLGTPGQHLVLFSPSLIFSSKLATLRGSTPFSDVFFFYPILSGIAPKTLADTQQPTPWAFPLPANLRCAIFLPGPRSTPLSSGTPRFYA